MPFYVRLPNAALVARPHIEEIRMSVLDPSPQGDVAADNTRSIVCPHCGQGIRLDEALRHQLAADLIARRETELREKAEHDATEKVRAALEDQGERLSELAGQLRQHQTIEKQLRQKQRELEDQKEAWDLERERMRDAIRKEEREQAAKLQQEHYEE